MEELKILKNHIKTWDEFFKIYSEEPINNVYVKSFDNKNLLKSLVRIFISDLLIYQSIYKDNAQSENFDLFLPNKIYIKGENERDGFNYPSIKCILNEDSHISKMSTLNKLFNDFGNDPKKILHSEIQNKILNNDFLFKKNGFYIETPEEDLEFEEEKSIYRKFVANDETSNLKRTDVLKFIIGLSNEKEKNFFSGDSIVQSLLNIAVFTKRNKVNVDKLRASSLRSSLAAVMSRNQSHNIGSHVLNKMSSSQVTQDFFDIYKNPKLCFLQDFDMQNKKLLPKSTLNDRDNVLAQLENKEINKDFHLATFENSEKIYKPVYILTQKPEINSLDPAELFRVFNNYLKQRMDFVADVATSDQFDFANKKFFISDMFRSFERNLLLLHNISGKGSEFPFTFKFEYYAKDETTLQKDFDPIVSIPNDVLGDQAFYILLENIIRNTAKHAPQKLGHITFTIKIEDKFDDFFKVSVYDDIQYINAKNKKLEGEDSNCQDNTNRSDTFLQLIAERNNNIAQPILDPETNEIRAHGWGTIEMKIACCYLNGISSNSIDDYEYSPLGLSISKEIENEKVPFDFQSYNDFLNSQINRKGYQDWSENSFHFFREKNDRKYLPLLQAVDGSSDANSGFGYSFLLKKPKEILILDKEGLIGKTLQDLGLDSLTSKGLTAEKALQQIGIDVCKEIDKNTVYVHNYFLLIGNDLKDYTNWNNLPQEMYGVVIDKENGLSKFSYFDYSKQDMILDNRKRLQTYLKLCLENSDATNLTRVFNDLYLSSVEELVTPVIGNSDGLGTQNLHKLSFERILNRNNIENHIKGYYEHHGLEKHTFYEKLGDSGFVELYGSSSRIGFFLMSLDNEIKKTKNKSLLHNMSDANYYFLAKGSNTKIAIVDERVQKVLNDEAFIAEKKSSARRNGDYKYSYKDIFRGIKISVPDEDEINLNQTGLNTKRKQVLEWIGRKTKICHYLIIHFGIIESLRIDKKGIIQVKNEIKELCDANSCKLVITSGRGFTKDVASLNEYFLSYSSLSNLVLDKNNRSKAHLVSVLNALRKNKTKNG